MTVRAQIQTQAAAAAKAALDMQGATGAYNDPGQSPVTISINPQSMRQKADNEDALFDEITEREFFIPLQTGFPQTGGPFIGALMTFGGKSWYAISWNIDSVKAGYKGTFQSYLVTRMGVK